MITSSKPRVIQPKVTEYFNSNVYSGDNYLVLPRETPIHEVIQIAFESGCYGFARSSNDSLCGKYYIRSPDKLATDMIEKLNSNKESKGVNFYVLE
jgi:hypothetical protein